MLPALARLLEERGMCDEAEVWYERAAMLRDITAMTGLGRLLERRSAFDKAEIWYERANRGATLDCEGQSSPFTSDLDAGANDVSIASMLLNPCNWFRVPKLIRYLEGKSDEQR